MPRSHLPEDFSVDKLPPPTAFDPTDAVSQSVSQSVHVHGQQLLGQREREREGGGVK